MSDPSPSEKKQSQGEEDLGAFRYKRNGGENDNKGSNVPGGNQDDVKTERYVKPGNGNNGRDSGDMRRSDPNKVDSSYQDVGAMPYNRNSGDKRDVRRDDRNDRGGNRGDDRRDDRRRDDNRNGNSDEVQTQRYTRPSSGGNGGGDRRDDRRDDRKDEVQTQRYTRPSSGGSDRRDDRNGDNGRDLPPKRSYTTEGYQRPSGGGGGGGDAIAQFEKNNPDEGYGKYTKPRGGSGGGGYSGYRRDDRGGGGGGYVPGPRIKLEIGMKEKIRTQHAKKKSVEELQDDPLNPLSSKSKSFEDLKVPEDILKGLQAMGFNRPSSVQGKTLPVILTTKSNIIAQSQSGTGKTACFAIGVLNTVDPKIEAPQVIVVSPTMELAKQNCDVICRIGEFRRDISILEATKGRRYPRVVVEQVICGTPGTICGLLRRRKINSRDVSLLVLDEADAILEQRTNALRDQTENIKRMLPPSVRILLFSATFEVEDDGSGRGRKFESREDEEKENMIRSFAKEFVPDPKMEILIPKERLTLETMAQYWVSTANFDQKVDILKDMYAELTIGQSIIFINTKKSAEMLRYRMEKDGHTVSILHSEVPLMERRVTMDTFRKNESKVLITTNVLSRGVDVPTVTMVINFDVPENHENRGEPDYATYLHRIGRTARFGGYGTAVSFVEIQKEYMIEKLEKFYNTKIEKMSSENIDKIQM